MCDSCLTFIWFDVNERCDSDSVGMRDLMNRWFTAFGAMVTQKCEVTELSVAFVFVEEVFWSSLPNVSPCLCAYGARGRNTG